LKQKQIRFAGFAKRVGIALPLAKRLSWC